MSRSPLAVLSLIVAFVLPACRQAADQTEADAEAIRALLEEHHAAINAGDVARNAALFAGDAVLMPPDEPAVVGREAIHGWYEAGAGEFTAQVTTTSLDEVVVSGDWGFSRHSYSITLTPVAGGEPIQGVGKGIHIYGRQPDGSWKFTRDIWNGDLPPSGME